MSLRFVLAVLVAYAPSSSVLPAESSTELPTQVASRSFPLQQPIPEAFTLGGLFVHDVNGDGRLDFVVTSEGHLGVYDHWGALLWMWRGPVKLFEYSHHPSAIAGDLDGDGLAEIAVFNQQQEIVVRDGQNGDVQYTLGNLGKPIAMCIANLRGLGDQDIVLQYDLTHLRAIQAEDGKTLWETDEYRAIEHSPLRQADLDRDGRDEIAGAALIDHDGKRMHGWELEGSHQSMDSMVIGDIIPGGPLEVALAEQRGARSRTDVINSEGIVWCVLNPWNWEDPDKLAVCDFDPGRPGLELFNRSSGGDGTAPRGREEPFVSEEAPWVLDSQGKVIAQYYVNDHKPEWWTGHGLEEISCLDWDGDAAHELVGQERHKNGAVAIVDALTGEFRVVIPAQAMRTYAVDLEGDTREEVVVVDKSGVVKVLRNTAPNPHPGKARLWTQNHYRRQKQNWDYYSP